MLLVQDSFRFPPGDFGSSFTSTTVLQILVLFLHSEFGMRFAPSVHGNISLQNWYSFSLFPLTEEGATSALGFWPIIYPLSSSLQSQSANICWLSFCRQSVRITISFTRVRFRSTDSLTHILYFLRQASRSWPTFLICLLMVSLWRPVNSNMEG